MTERVSSNFMKKVDIKSLPYILTDCYDIIDCFVSFESVVYPGHYLGVMDNGQLKKPVRVESPSSYDFFDIKNAER